LLRLLGVDYRFNHFDANGVKAVARFVPNLPEDVQVVIPARPYADVKASWLARGHPNTDTLEYDLNVFFTWLPRIRDPFFVPIGPGITELTRIAVVRSLAAKFGVDHHAVRDPSGMRELIDSWRPVGSRFRDDNLIDDRKSLVVKYVLKSQDRAERWLNTGKEKK
jgi:hypothetical protein